MNKPVILAAGTPQVLLPYDNATLFERNLASHRSPLASWTAWVVPVTLKAAEAARRVGMDEDRAARGQPHPAAHAGQGRLDAAGAARCEARHRRVRAGRRQRHDGAGARRAAAQRLSFKAGKKGDSVAAVARRYRVSASQVAAWNAVAANARFQPGQTIVVMQAGGHARGADQRRQPAGREPGRGAQPGKTSKASQQAVERQSALSAGRTARARSCQIDVLEFAAGRHAARQPRDREAARAQRLAERVRGGLALGGEAGGQDHFAHDAVGGALEQPAAPMSATPMPSSGLMRPISTKYRPR